MDIVGETVLSTFLENLFERLLSLEFLNFVRGGELHDSLEKLKLTLSAVATVVNDAEEKQFERPIVEAWLKLLKNAVYDAEDVLDEIAIKALEQRLKPEPEFNGKVWDFFAKYRKVISDTLRNFKEGTESKIMKIIDSLEYLVKQKDVLGLRDVAQESSSRVRKRPETTSLLNEVCVYGRDNDREKIIQLLLSDEADVVTQFSVIPIIGMAGVGKTTLAQAIYNDKRVEDYFDLKSWVYVSDQFDMKHITKTIIGSFSQEIPTSDDLNNLQVNLQEKLIGKRFLLVLDDVWNEDYNQWVSLRKPLRAGAEGSKILITTQNAGVSSIMRTVPDHILGLLSDEDCWELFKQHAVDICTSVNPKMEAIGRAIVKKCKGLPLAASTIGGLLRSKLNVDEWCEILDSGMWCLSDDSGILPALKLSYHHLPINLKRCFAYCSIFPKDYEFREEELVLLWIAEGFVPQLKGIRMEDLARKYFHGLLSRSLFQQRSPDKLVYVMHGLVHDLAKAVSEGICFRLEDIFEGGSQYKIPKSARHLSYIRDYYEPLTKFAVFDPGEISLRTFLALGGGRKFSHMPGKVLLELLPKLKYLRVLSLNSYQITDLPESIGKLKHLRYLDISYTSVRRLPESTSTLYNLQTLLLVGCHSLIELPFDIGNLINLKHLDMSQSSLRKMPFGIGRLVSLQRLSSFIVGKHAEPGIRELRNLVHLQGSVSITGLQNVLDVRDVIEANFENKLFLSALELEWSKEIHVLQNEESAEELISLILSMTKLKELTICYYHGKRLPAPQHNCLKTLVLSNLLGLVEWPSLGVEEDVFCSLRHLQIQACPKLRRISHRFAALEKLIIEGCEELVALDRLTSTGKLEKGMPFFPSLLELSIECCPTLLKLPTCLFSLKELRIIGCMELNMLSTEEEMPHLYKLSIQDCPELRKLPTLLPSLVQLHLRGCLQLFALPRSSLLSNLRLEECDEVLLRNVFGLHSLTSLYICKIQRLSYLSECLLKQLTSLKELEIHACDMLEVLFMSDACLQHLVSLQKLLIFNCPKLEVLPHQMHKLTALNKLEIWACPRLQPLAEMKFPSKLQDLWISSELESLPSGMMQSVSLERLSIWNSHSLTSFPRCKLPGRLKTLSIMTCSKLEYLPGEMMECNNSLESLSIESCDSLCSLGLRNFTASTATKLRELKIIGCGNLKRFPEDIHNLTSLCLLTVVSCPHLVSFPDGGFPTTNLRKIHVSKCYELKSLPVHNVTSLQDLTVRRCPNLKSFPEGALPTKLERLVVDSCGNLKPISEWGFGTLKALKSLGIIGGYADQVFFPERMLPSSLTALSIKHLPKLKVLGRALQHLKSLKYLRIVRCHDLSALPEESLPVNLCFLQIVDCPRVKEQYEMKKNIGLHQYSLISCLSWDDDF
ncbi:putative disease resistance RPP13-like protein 1 [Herrania umbratica]|uniref:Disease resistance RPP13-like protein 1 n=1 Tax=Herrania umbratica TaxID=108875 RepID=A0A6J1A3Q8_9ROSI|nr:putative disease resistance RPP13-like protein 1 [Herrania umbratica]XP_021281491.1 putative disease resistance RPP13-like protein 1 [Herrania umbratica]